MFNVFRIVVALLGINLVACTTVLQDTNSISAPVDTTLSSSLAEFCKKLPRPEYQDLELLEVSDGWFEVYQVGDGVWAIYEPHQWQEVISYLITGNASAVLFDSGNGMGNIKAIVDQLTSLPVTVINSHSHIDHIGGNYQFDNIASIATDFSRTRSEGVDDTSVKEEASAAALCKPLPAGVTEENHVIKPYTISRVVRNNQLIDLGGRELTVLSIPGHTDDSIALLDREAGYLWTGDSYYAGPIWLFADETELSDYRKTIQLLAVLSPQLNALFPAHNTPRVDPSVLTEVAIAFEQVFAGLAESETEWEGVLRFQFDGFSFLVREDYQQQLNH